VPSWNVARAFGGFCPGHRLHGTNCGAGVLNCCARVGEEKKNRAGRGGACCVVVWRKVRYGEAGMAQSSKRLSLENGGLTCGRKR